ncbi:MAG TPA: SatD family protein [Puia sp.]|jgi:hypothetical protein|nr:SatD family protein [Puia sp.]
MGKHAIITGDIVASRRIAPMQRERLYSDITAFLKTLKKKWIVDYETYRGDSIQCEARSPQSSLRVALIIRSYVMAYIPEKAKKKMLLSQKKKIVSKGYYNVAFDIRLAIGIGEVDFIRRKKIGSSDGKAFQLSGEALDDLKEEYRRLVLKTNDKELDEDIEPVIFLLDALTQKWTQNQAELVLNKLQNKKDEEIAKLFNISLSAVTQRKRTAQWMAIEKAVVFFETKMKS